jgi:hypothetical protein
MSSGATIARSLSSAAPRWPSARVGVRSRKVASTNRGWWTPAISQAALASWLGGSRSRWVSPARPATLRTTRSIDRGCQAAAARPDEQRALALLDHRAALLGPLVDGVTARPVQRNLAVLRSPRPRTRHQALGQQARSARAHRHAATPPSLSAAKHFPSDTDDPRRRRRRSLTHSLRSPDLARAPGARRRRWRRWASDQARASDKRWAAGA